MAKTVCEWMSEGHGLHRTSERVASGTHGWDGIGGGGTLPGSQVMIPTCMGIEGWPREQQLAMCIVIGVHAG